MLTAGAVHARRDEPAEEVATSRGQRDATERADQTQGRTAARSTNRQPSRETRHRNAALRRPQAHPNPNAQRETHEISDRRAGRRPIRGAARPMPQPVRCERRLRRQRATRRRPPVSTFGSIKATQPRETMSISPHRAPDTAARARRVHPWNAHATRPQRPSRRKGHDEPRARATAGLACARPDAAPHDAGDEGRRPRREAPPRWRAEQAASGRRAAR